MAREVLLAGDIGATKTDLALFACDSPGTPLFRQTLLNADFPSFEALLHRFLAKTDPAPAWACFGVAGPVLDGRVCMTNLDWTIEAEALQQTFGWQQVRLINDLVATALGALTLPETALYPLNPGTRREGAALAVLAPGSGLGEAFLVPADDGGWIPCPSEGGHVDFAPRNEEQAALLRFLWRTQPHVSVEQVCSGLAIPTLFAFCSTRFPVPDWLEGSLAAATVQTPIIVEAALRAAAGEEPCEVALRSLELFWDLVAAEAANLTLKTLAFGGLFLGGGLPPRLLPLLDTERFMRIFVRGAYQDQLAQVPIRLILAPHTALLGAAAHGASLACRHC
ncbi:MAG: glucokinase [Desulfobulbus sp.]|jgi:glucokinase